MATPKQSISENDKFRRSELVVCGAIVTIDFGDPTPPEVSVSRNGTVQFVNHDPIDYRLRLWVRDRKTHPDVDLLLPGRCGVTVVVDEEIGVSGECYYQLYPLLTAFLGCSDDLTATRRVASAEASAAELSTEESMNLAEDVANVPPPSPPNPPVLPVLAALVAKGPGGGVIKVP